MISPSLMQGPGASKFSDPFILPSTESFPRDIRSTFDLCLYLWRMNRIYGAATNRITSYFITGLEITSPEGASASEANKKELKKALVEQLQLFNVLQEAGINWAIYGNAFVRCVEPFDRWLVDRRGNGYKVLALDIFPEEHITYDWESMEYTVPDLTKMPKGKSKKNFNWDSLPTVSLPFRDKPASAVDRFSVVFIDPRYIELDKAHHAKGIEYIHRIPPDMESRIKNNILHEINNTPRGLLRAVSQGKDFRFRRGEIYHFKGPQPVGVSDSGWAVPEVLLHYDALYQLQIYRKTDFAVAQDYLLPFRIISPQSSNMGNGSPVNQAVMPLWMSQMSSMIAKRRQDLTAIHATTFPVQMQENGGGRKDMVMHDLVTAYTDMLFDGLGFPREMFRGSMNVDQFPNAVRIFERQYEWLYRELNNLTQFVAKVLQRSQESQELEVNLKRPSMLYNAELLAMRMQMVANQELPRSSVYPDIGVDNPEEAAVKALEEAQAIQKRTEKVMMDFEKEKNQGSMAEQAMMAAEQGLQQGGGAPPQGGGAPMDPVAAGGGPGLDYSVIPDENPEQLQQRAQQVAETWLSMHAQQPSSHTQEMRKAEAQNPTLYAQAKNMMDKMRSSFESQGRQQGTQMLAGGGQ